MSPQDWFGVALRTLAVFLVASGLAAFFAVLGSIATIAIGLALFLVADPLARLAYRNGEPLADWWKNTIAPMFGPKEH